VTSPEYVNLSVESADGVSTIVLDRPGHINAYSSEMYREIRRATRAADEDPETSVIVFTAAGTVFGAGGDLHEMLGLLDAHEPGGGVYAFRDDLPFTTIRACRKPTIAAPRGTCVGGGFALATACDLVIAAEGTRMGIPEARVGLIDGLAISTLYGHVPLPALRYLLFTGSLIDATEALRLGMLLEVVPADVLMDRVAQVAREMQACGPTAIEAYKRVLRSYERPDHLDDVMDILVRDPQTADRIRTFFAERGAKV
jgi:enoyl-CoA hydratase/carnithine racemase